MNVTTPCYYTNQCSQPDLTNNYYNDIRFRNYINFAINTFATIIAGFIIVYGSTKAMKMYRWFLLNIAVCFTRGWPKNDLKMYILDMVLYVGLQYDIIFHSSIFIPCIRCMLLGHFQRHFWIFSAYYSCAIHFSYINIVSLWCCARLCTVLSL